jgi:hypothetical protein
MLTLILLLAVAVLAIVFARAWQANLRRNKRLSGLAYFANIAEGRHERGLITYLPDNAFATRWLVCKRGASAGNIDVCTATDVPLGIVEDETGTTANLTIPLAVRLFGGACDITLLGQAGAANAGVIAQDALLVADAAGQLKTLPAGAGTYYVVGRALNATTVQGDLVEFSPTFFKHII